MRQPHATHVTRPPWRNYLQRGTCALRRHLRQALDDVDNRAAWLSQRPLFCVLAGIMSGSAIGITVPLSPPLIALALLAVVLVWRRWPQVHLQRCCRLLLTGLLLTHLQLAWQQRALPLDHIAHWLPAAPRQRISIDGRLYRPVETRGDRQRLYVRLHRLRDTQGWRPVSGRVRLNVHTTALTFLPGDVIRVHRLRLYPIRNFQNPGAFDYRGLMRRQGIYAVGGISRPDRVRLLQRPPGWRPAGLFVRWRRRLTALVQTHLPPSLAPVFTAMVLGQRGHLPAALQDAFRATGTAHLLVVSGLHVGFVLVACFLSIRTVLRPLRSCLPRAWLPAWRPTPLAALLCLPPVLLYCSVVGWKVSTIRAALMVGSSMLALVLSRSHDLMYALCLAAALILVFDAQALFTLGFQLSFAAVATILLVHQRLAKPDEATRLAERWRKRLWMPILATTAAYAGTLPILASAFHIIPTYGALSNFVLVPLAGVIVPAGVAALALSVAWPALAAVVFPPLGLLLSWVTAGTLCRQSAWGASPRASAFGVRMRRLLRSAG